MEVVFVYFHLPPPKVPSFVRASRERQKSKIDDLTGNEDEWDQILHQLSNFWLMVELVIVNQLSPGIHKERTEMKRQREAAQFFGYQKRLMQTGVRPPDAWLLQYTWDMLQQGTKLKVSSFAMAAMDCT